MNPRRIPFLNSTTLATLLSAFLRVKLNGGVLDVYESFLGSNRKAAHSVQDQESSLKRLKVVKDAFNLVVGVLENEIVLLQEACLPVTMKRGMQSLPDDLLREIFELATEEYEFSMPKDPELPMKLANVNRRFRSVALRTPSLWSKLTNDLKLGQLKIYISRSRVSGLSIYIMSNSSDDVGLHLPLRKFFEMTTEHKNRWTHLFFGSSNTEGGYSHPAFRGFQGLFLPGLTSLCWEKYDYDRTADPHPTIAPFSTWIMPNLTQFEGLGVMVDITTVGTGILSWKMGYEKDYESWNLSSSFQTMEQSSMLKSLNFDISFLTTENFAPPFKFKLKNLHTFELRLLDRIDPPALETFFSCVDMPVLADFIVTYGDNLSWRATSWSYELILQFAARRRILQKFSLRFMDNHKLSEMTLGEIAEKLPNLNEVIIRGAGLCGPFFRTTPSWRILRLEDCNRIDYEGVAQLVGRLSERPDWNMFRIYITECKIPPALKYILQDNLVYDG